jgi:hypothetical protein
MFQSWYKIRSESESYHSNKYARPHSGDSHVLDKVVTKSERPLVSLNSCIRQIVTGSN